MILINPLPSIRGKNDFLGEDGMGQPIMSKVGMYEPDLKKEHPVVLTIDRSRIEKQSIIFLSGVLKR